MRLWTPCFTKNWTVFVKRRKSHSSDGTPAYGFEEPESTEGGVTPQSRGRRNGFGSRNPRPAAGAGLVLPSHLARVYALRSVEQTLKSESESKAGVETGGVLVGFLDHKLDAVVVTAASGPGPGARHSAFSFNRDRAFCQAFIDRHAAESAGCIDFVGEWHKHPEPNPWPSPTDCSTYVKLAIDANSHVDRPVVLISGTTRTREIGWRWVEAYVGVNAFVFRAHGFEQRPIRWLPDEAYDDLIAHGVDVE
ncbi:MAG: hypothetical protein JWM41_257 [Gemmatimonadetes bacterium]|nr:hypothetical protein [Gemmatimonadota bacterium]